MPEVHKNLGISDAVFDSACQVFIASLRKFNLKEDVHQTFVDRISGLRPDICFPPVVERSKMDEENSIEFISENTGSLFDRLGQEVGLR